MRGKLRNMLNTAQDNSTTISIIMATTPKKKTEREREKLLSFKEGAPPRAENFDRKPCSTTAEGKFSI